VKAVPKETGNTATAHVSKAGGLGHKIQDVNEVPVNIVGEGSEKESEDENDVMLTDW
jgi:hypothetical protein